MPTIVEVLKNNPESYPNWLQNTPIPFNRDRFFSSRNVFYPGSGNDRQPVELCAQAHAAHTFVYADYGVDRQTIEEWLHHPQHRFLGYTIIHKEKLTKSDIVPRGWVPHVSRSELPKDAYWFVRSNFVPFALYVVLERDDGYDEHHGPERIAGLFIGGDGFATFDALYCQEYEVAAPYLIHIEDHGFGGNIPEQCFGRGGLLETLARDCDKRPTWLLVGETSDPWDEYVDIGADPEPCGKLSGAMHDSLRSLYGIGSAKSTS